MDLSKESGGEVKIEEQVVTIAAISSGTDANDMFSMDLPKPRKRRNCIVRLKKKGGGSAKNVNTYNLLIGKEN